MRRARASARATSSEVLQEMARTAAVGKLCCMLRRAQATLRHVERVTPSVPMTT